MEIPVGPPLQPLTDFEVQQVMDGLMIPNPDAVRWLAFMVRKLQGTPNPQDL